MLGYGRVMKKQEKQELVVIRIQEYIRSGDYPDADSIEVALESEFGHRLGRLSRFSKQEINEQIEQSR